MNCRILTEFRSRLAEGPLYHTEENVVYWTDIEGGKLHKWDPMTNESHTVHSGSPIGGFTIQEDGSLLLFRESGAIHVLRGSHLEVVLESIPEESATRFNDVAADPLGGVFCGTMSTETRKGRLYRLAPNGSLTVVLEDVGCSNGIGWSPDLTKMYFTDSGDRSIFEFDYDAETSSLANRRVLFKMDSEGTPDGMTVDADGNIWTAIWGGGKILKLSPSGEIVEQWPLPAVNITCPTFGGDLFDQLYVTAAGGHEPEHGEGAGELMVLSPGVKGKPEFRSRVAQDVK